MCKAETYRADTLSRLTEEHGYLIDTRVLAKVLGFRSYSALRQAISRGALNLPLINVPGRRARHALASDVADWLTARFLESRELGNCTGPCEMTRKSL